MFSSRVPSMRAASEEATKIQGPEHMDYEDRLRDLGLLI